jgi:hypothetical protein
VPHKPVNFKRSDLQRAIRALREEGISVDRVEFMNDGGFAIHPKLEIANVEARENTEVEGWIGKHRANKR